MSAAESVAERIEADRALYAAAYAQGHADGLAEGLTLIARTVEVHWESLHPDLRTAARPVDAAQRRIAALRTLAPVV